MLTAELLVHCELALQKEALLFCSRFYTSRLNSLKTIRAECHSYAYPKLPLESVELWEMQGEQD